MKGTFMPETDEL